MMTAEDFQHFAECLSTAQKRISQAMAFVKNDGHAQWWFVATIEVLDEMKDNEASQGKRHGNRARRYRQSIKGDESVLSSYDFEKFSMFTSSAQKYMRKSMSYAADRGETHISIQMGINLLESFKDDLCPIKQNKQET